MENHRAAGVSLARTSLRPAQACTSACTVDLSITSRMLGVDLDGSRRIRPAHVGWPVGPDGSRRIQTDRLDDHRDDQSASDEESDGKVSNPKPATPPTRARTAPS